MHMMIRTLLTVFVFAVMSTGLASAQVPGVTAKSILLGQSAAFSGPAAQLGIQMNIGTKAYFDYVNSQGGVHGRKIELKTRDDKYEANLCVEATKKLIGEDKVFALVSYVGTPTTGAAMPTITEAKVPLVGPFTGAELLRTPVSRYVFNVRASYYEQENRGVLPGRRLWAGGSEGRGHRHQQARSEDCRPRQGGAQYDQG